MKLVNALKKLEKAGAVVEQNDIFFSAKFEKDVIEFMCQKGTISCISVKRIGEQSNPQIDYFPGVWCRNLSNAIQMAQ